MKKKMIALCGLLYSMSCNVFATTNILEIVNDAETDNAIQEQTSGFTKAIAGFFKMVFDNVSLAGSYMLIIGFLVAVIMLGLSGNNPTKKTVAKAFIITICLSIVLFANHENIIKLFSSIKLMSE